MNFHYLIWFMLNLVENNLVSSRLPRLKTAQTTSNWDSISGGRAHESLFSFHISIRAREHAFWTINQTHCYIKTKYITSPDLFFGLHVCSASLISTQHLLTSAQCVISKIPSDLQAVVGSISLSKNGELHAISQVHIHSKHFQNNVALLKMTPPYDNTQMAFYTLLQKRAFEPNSNLILIGWEGANKSLCNHMQFGQLQWLSVDVCNSKCSFSLTDKQFCAVTEEGKGACVGNFGSPLLTYNFETRLMRLVGIMSYSEFCSVNYPTVFTNVSFYITWIRTKCDFCNLF